LTRVHKLKQKHYIWKP